MIDYPQLIFWTVAVSFLFQIFYALYFFVPFLKHQENNLPDFDKPVSVIVSAKNEARNLRNNIPLWLDQDYPDFEVIVINDRSTDDTEKVLREFEHYSRLKTVQVPFQEWKSFIGNKKFALTLGIKAARYDYLLFTDADCKPASGEWIKRMASGFSSDKEIILGYGKYQKESSYLNSMIRYETLLTALQYFGYAVRKMPYMGVGRNLAYTKNLFFRNDGFKNHFEILSGDDDLFINENATAHNTAICSNPLSHTISIPEKSWKSYFKQKRRHYSTAYHYKNKHKILLFLFSLTQMLFWLSSIILLFFQTYKYWVPAMILTKIFLSVGVVHYAGKKLDDAVSVWLIPLLEIHLVLMQLFIFVSGLFKRQTDWK